MPSVVVFLLLTGDWLTTCRYEKPKDKWKMQSISHQKETKRQLEAKQDSSVHNADLMGRFMRLCDVILVAGLIDLCHHGLEALISQLQANRRHGIMTVFGDLESVKPAPGARTSCTILFTPSKIDIEVLRH